MNNKSEKISTKNSYTKEISDNISTNIIKELYFKEIKIYLEKRYAKPIKK